MTRAVYLLSLYLPTLHLLTLKVFIFFICIFVFSSSAISEDLISPMQKVYQAFRSLQIYLVDEKKLNDEKNFTKIHTLLKDLNNNFHKISNIDQQYSKLPGFQSNLTAIQELLQDATQRFAEGKKDFVQWRLRAISRNCFTCHSTYNIHLNFDASGDLVGLSNTQKADFYLATRQIDKAKELLQKDTIESSSDLLKISAIRKLLILETRTQNSPTISLEVIQRTINNPSIAKYDSEMLAEWLIGLKRWKIESTQILDSLQSAERLIKKSSFSESLLLRPIDEISILRGTAILHRLLNNKKIRADERSRALLLLGYSYSKLPLFFIDELPEIYLEQCINEFPGSLDAKEAFRIYNDKTLLDYMGIGGGDIPAEISARLKELHDKAYAVPRLEGKT